MMVAIDGTDRGQLVIGVVRGRSLATHILKRARQEETLSLLFGFLRNSRISLKRLKGLAIVPGPGHFSSVREAAVLANTLAWQTGIPLFSLSGPISPSAFRHKKRVLRIQPKYGMQPHITRPKRFAT